MKPHSAPPTSFSHGIPLRCRCSSAANWQYPQGGIDGTETPEAAGTRELHEETGIYSVSLVTTHPEWLAYDFDIKTQKRLGAPMGRYRGQKQRYLLMRFEGSDAEIQLSVEGHQPEFDAYEWVAIEEAVERVVPFKRAVYEAVAAEFVPLIRGAVGAVPW